MEGEGREQAHAEGGHAGETGAVGGRGQRDAGADGQGGPGSSERECGSQPDPGRCAEDPEALKAEDLAVWAESLAEGLDEAPRLGALSDRPEGRRFIVVSDSLAGEISLRLRQAARLLRATT